MEIPNYDCGNEQNDYKQLYNYMPNQTFRMLMAAPSGGGKTNLLFHMLTKPLLYYDRLYLYAKNLEQEKYQNLMKTFEPISKEVGYDIFVCNNDEITPVENMGDNGQCLVIFDDFICEKNQKPLIDYFIRGRHKNCSVIYLSQSYYKTPKDIRLNCSHFCVYDFPSSNERNLISRELRVNKEDYIQATQKPYSFLYVDNPRKIVKRNFYGNI